MGRRMGLVCSAALAAAMVSCSETPTQSGDSLSANVAAASDSVQLTYICGNMFRIRNRSFEPRQVRWGTYNVPSDTGSLRVRGRDVGAAQVDYFVTAQTKGTMRLFVGTRLVDTKANGNKAACAEPGDASALPDEGVRSNLDYFSEPKIVQSDSVVFSRTVVDVEFESGASAATVRAFQRKFHAQLVGRPGDGFYLFRIPDSGVHEAGRADLLNAMAGAEGVRSVVFYSLAGARKESGARFPNDGSASSRAAMLSGSGLAWYAPRLRLPQAWWCETGQYGSPRPKLAVFEHGAPATLPEDIANSVTLQYVADGWKRDTAIARRTSRRDSTWYWNHSVGVTAAASARGDNSIGVAGASWNSDVRLLTLDNVGGFSPGADVFGQLIVPELIRQQPRILSLSSDFVEWTGRAHARAVAGAKRDFQRLLAFAPELLIVVASGNDATVGPLSEIQVHKRPVLLSALLELRDVPQIGSRIVVVGASDRSGSRWDKSNALGGQLDIYAPGQAIPALRYSGAVEPDSGTSWSAPTVAGIAALLFASNPRLSPAMVKDFLLRGARDSVEMSNGTDSLPRPIDAGVYEVDAFGSLRLLASRAGTPLCGARIVPLVDRDTALRRVLVYRYQNATPEAITFRASGSNTFMRVSPAPGGRSFSVDADTARIASLTSSGWSIGTLAGFSTVRFGERDTVLAVMTPSSCPACVSVTLARAQGGRDNSWSAEPVHGPSLALAPDGSAIGWADTSHVHVRRIGKPSVDVQGHWYTNRQQRTWTLIRGSAFSHDGGHLAFAVTRAECPPIGGGGPPDDGILFSIRGGRRVRPPAVRPLLDLYVPGEGFGFEAENCPGSGGVPLFNEFVNRSWLEAYTLAASSGAATLLTRPSEPGYIPWLDVSEGGTRWEFKRTQSILLCAVAGERLTTLSRLFDRSLPASECDPIGRVRG
jgi:hypothetical protein